MRVVMGVGAVRQDTFQLRGKDGVRLVPTALRPDLLQWSCCGADLSQVITSVFASPPGAVEKLYSTWTAVSSYDGVSIVALWIRAVTSCSTGWPGGGGELVLWETGEVVRVHVVV